MKPAKRIIILVVSMLVLLAGIWIWIGSDGAGMIYRTASITRGNIDETVTATGTLNPIELVMVGTQVSGQVEHIYVHLNAQVKKGELMADIDPSLLNAQLKQDQAGLETALVNYQQADRDLKRMRILLAKNYVAQVDMEHANQTYLQAKNSYDASKMQVERDKVNLGYTKITAPISGTVISQDVTVGQTVQASFQTPNLFKIAGDLTKMKIDVNLSEADIGRVKPDLPVMFTVDAFPNREFTGKVQSVDLNPNTQQGVVTYTVSVSVDNNDRSLLPGMTAYASIMLSQVKNVLRVPAAALRFVPPAKQSSGLARLFTFGIRSQTSVVPALTGSTIYLLRGGAVPVPVAAGVSDGTYVQVSGKGIHEGDTVITGIVPGGAR